MKPDDIDRMIEESDRLINGVIIAMLVLIALTSGYIGWLVYGKGMF